jgi:uncharacterized protein with NRDE domain
LAFRAHPRWILVAAANRDELHARPSAPLARFDDRPHLIAGRDLRSGGTWLGVSEEGRFAAVTNLRGFGPPDPARVSRGGLVTDLLAAAGTYADAELQDFNPFNAVSVNGEGALFLSNRPDPVRRPLAPGVYGMSNGPLDEPWVKTVRLKERLVDWMAAGHRVEALLDDLHDDVAARDGAPDTEETAPASIFVLNPVYGTRCSTVVAIDVERRGLIIERRYARGGEITGETALPFAWR